MSLGLDSINYRKLRVARDKFVYIFSENEEDWFYNKEIESSIKRFESDEKRMGEQGKLVRINKVIRLVSQSLEAIGLHGSKVYYPELARNVVRSYYATDTNFLSEMDIKRLANSKFKMGVRAGECFFYDANLERLDCFMERLIRFSLEKTVCPY